MSRAHGLGEEWEMGQLYLRFLEGMLGRRPGGQMWREIRRGKREGASVEGVEPREVRDGESSGEKIREGMRMELGTDGRTVWVCSSLTVER